jgi:acetate kinase
MKVLVINCGSSSLKYELFDLASDSSLINGNISRIGLEGAEHKFTTAGGPITEPISAPDHKSALDAALKALTSGDGAPVKSLSEIKAVGHRIGHGGTRYRGPVMVDEEVEGEIERLIPLMPLHHPAMLAGIRGCREALPGISHVAVFDTAFHGTIPDEAAVYGMPHKYFADGVKKYGFHGNSHEFVAEKAAEYLEVPLKKLNIITCHLGNGASLCAIHHGRSIDTSMGFSPMQGLIMGTRSGDIDPGIFPYLARSSGLSIDEIDKMLNSEGGLLGISGVSSDMRETLEAAEAGNPRALLAIKAFCYRIKHYIGAYHAILGGADAVVFTGGIGENSRGIRIRSLQGLEKLGFAVDQGLNDRCTVDDSSPVFNIGARHSGVEILVVSTNEELMIARQCAKALDYRARVKSTAIATDRRPIRIAVSVRHAHLCQADVEALFGKGYKLTEKARLYQDSEFAANETIKLIGPRGTVENVRILGPERKRTQIEISRTEEFKLGIDAPVRDSGDLDGTPGLTIEGPAGKIDLREGVICARRHIHMSPKDAEDYGVQDKDTVMVKIEGERELIFGGVLVRVKPEYRLEMHIDTDEANASELPPVSEGFLATIESGV